MCRDRLRFSTDVVCLAGNEARWQLTQNSSYFPSVCHLSTVRPSQEDNTENKERYRLFLTPLFSNSSLSHGRLVQPVVIYFISFFLFSVLWALRTLVPLMHILFLALVYLYPPWPRKCGILQFIKTCFYTSFHHNQVVAHSNSRWISCNS